MIDAIAVEGTVIKQGRTHVVALILIMTGGLIASCSTGAKTSQSAPSPSTAASASRQSAPAGQEAAACRFITPSVLAIAALPNVAVVTPVGQTEPGLSICTYGDSHDPKLLSLNSLTLTEASAAFLRARGLSADGAAQVDDDCVADASRETGPGQGLGNFATWCVGRPGSTRGKWIQNGAVYTLDYFSPSDAALANDARLDRFGAIARAISSNIGG